MRGSLVTPFPRGQKLNRGVRIESIQAATHAFRGHHQAKPCAQ
jgi:hypothetical protein